MLYNIDLFSSLTVGALPTLLAQQSSGGALSGLFAFVIFLALYGFIAFCWQTIFTKCGVENPWFAWIPILNTYAGFKAGGEQEPVLWTVLTLVPCINIVAVVKFVIAWINICKKIEKSPWLLLAILIPVIGAPLLFGYLAFA